MIKKRVFQIISKADENDNVSRVFDISIMALIVLSVLSIILESFEDLRTKYTSIFSIFEYVTVVVFTIEYFARIWTADLLYPNSKHPYIKYLTSFMAIIDLLAILPFYIPFISSDLRFLRLLRLLRMTRLLRVFKLGRYIDSLKGITNILKASAVQLIASVSVCLVLLLFASILMYAVENPAQPEAFPNVMASLWWAVCTLTTVGYGDVYPITALGKILASIIAFLGVGIIAIPTGIISAGFMNAVDKNKKTEDEEQKKSFCPYCGKKID